MIKLITILLLVWANIVHSQSSCATAISLQLDGVCRTYNFSNTTQVATNNCNDLPYDYTGLGRVIYFSFTTGATVTCINAKVNLQSTANLEVAVYQACGQNPAQSALYFQTVCFNDGNGYWAIDNAWGEVQPNTTYYLRLRAAPGYNGTLTICATQPTITNGTCQTATPIPVNGAWYNNSCHQPGNIIPGDLCAYSLENTAWYTYTTTGIATKDIINVGAINCDNYIPSHFGYQFGIFTGSCNNLQSYGPCFSDTSGSLQFPLAFPAGTVVYFAVDGRAGSNCQYHIWTGNQPLPIQRDNRIIYTPIYSVRWKQISIYNVNGQLLRRYSGEYNDSDLNVYPQGVYIVVTTDKNDKLFSYQKVR